MQFLKQLFTVISTLTLDQNQGEAQIKIGWHPLRIVVEKIKGCFSTFRTRSMKKQKTMVSYKLSLYNGISDKGELRLSPCLIRLV